MHDAGKDRSTRDHLRTYPRNLHSMILDPNKNHKWLAFEKEVVPPVRKLIQENEKCVIFMFCKSGRHRSVSNAKLFYDLVKETYEVDAELLHISDGPNWRHLCGNCDECSWKDPAARKVADQVMDAVRDHWYNFGPKVWVRKDGQRRLGDDGVVVDEPTPAGAAQTARAGSSNDPLLPGSAPKSTASPGSTQDSAAPPDMSDDHDDADPSGTAEMKEHPPTIHADTFSVDTQLRGECTGPRPAAMLGGVMSDKDLEKAGFLFPPEGLQRFQPGEDH